MVRNVDRTEIFRKVFGYEVENNQQGDRDGAPEEDALATLRAQRAARRREASREVSGDPPSISSASA